MTTTTLFEQLTLCLCRNKRTFTISHDTYYNNRVYTCGSYTFMEMSEKEVVITGPDFYFKATNAEELFIMLEAIVR